MSVSLHPNNATDQDGEVSGHDYRLSEDQHRRTIEAGIITEADEVELRDGFLCLKPDSGDSRAERHYRLSLDQYRAMADQDILTTDDRIELLEGWLVAKMTKHRPHVVSANRAFHLLTGLLPVGWYVAKEDPVQGTDSEPEPDLSVVRGTTDDYLLRTPGPGDVALLIEVADSSLSRDRSSKKRLYARAGFPAYWIINLVAGQIEVYTEPTGPIARPDYRQRRDFGLNEMLPLALEGREVGRIAVRDLIP